jgi:purine-nucleoside phosphorylase
MSGDTSLDGTTAAVAAILGGRRPDVAVVLGSGFGALAKELRDAAALDFQDIPGFTGSSVTGHAGRLVCGTLQGRCILVYSGRFHHYEGHPPELVALPVRLAGKLGIEMLLLTNAAGGIRGTFRPGEVMLIRDHINMMWRSPLAGRAMEGELRFPDCSEPYDPVMCEALRQSARAIGVSLHEGVYAAVLGPSYETPAEIRMLQRLGADAVGMSTVPEVLTAAARRMRVAAVSCITNRAAGLSDRPLSHADVLAAAGRASGTLLRLLRGALAALPAA